jgi:hypothetical protein
VQTLSGQSITTIIRSSNGDSKDQSKRQGQRQEEDEKIGPYITTIGRVWYRFIIDINRIKFNNI